MERPHAEAVADIVRAGHSGLATEAGLDTVRRATEAGLDAVRRELATHRWVLGLNVAMTMAILAVMLAQAFSL